MKQGTTPTLEFKLDIEISNVTEVIFTFTDELAYKGTSDDETTSYLLQKNYPDDATFEDDVFKLPLTQEETDLLTNTFYVEAQVICDKAVVKSDIKKINMPHTLWTTYVDDNESDGQSEVIHLSFSDNVIVEGGGSSNYNDLTNKPRINNIELVGNKTTSDLGLDITAGDGLKRVGNVVSVDNGNYLYFDDGKLTISTPTLGTSRLRSALVDTGLVSSYKPLATREYVDNLISTSLKRLVVEQLPQNPNTYTIYMVLRQAPTTNNIYDEYMYINNAWELIGTTEVDLSGYQEKLIVGNGIDITNNTISAKVRNLTDNALTVSRYGLYVSKDTLAVDGGFRQSLADIRSPYPLQPKLTAGTNITIDSNNVISASGGGNPITDTAKGSTISLTDSAESPLDAISIMGKSTQTKTNGYQLSDLTEDNYFNKNSQIVMGTTIKVSKGSIINAPNGSPFNYANTRFLYWMFDNIEVGKTYTIKTENDGDAIASMFSKYNPNPTSSSDKIITLANGLSYTYTFTAESDVVYVLELRTPTISEGGASSTPTTMTIMLSEGSTEKEWEEYTGKQPSPSIDYPQAITDITTEEIEITNGTDTQSAELSRTLRGIPVSSGGNYTDNNGQQWVCDTIERYKDESGKYIQRIGYIASYNGETITTDYISTTGGLNNGSSIIYILDTPIETPLTSEEIAELELSTYYPTTNISSNADVVVEYVVDIETALSSKQDKLTAGTNITIDSNNVISASGGSYTFTNGLTESSGTVGIDIASGSKLLIDANDKLDVDLSSKQDTIDSTHKLSADNVDDTNSTNKFVSANEKSTWNAKADNTTISTDTTSTTVSLTLADNHEYRYTQDLTSLTLTMPSGDFISSIVFASGSTPTSMTYDSSIKWSGDDVTSNAFVPQANMEYEIVFWYNGLSVNAVVRGVA